MILENDCQLEFNHSEYIKNHKNRLLQSYGENIVTREQEWKLLSNYDFEQEVLDLMIEHSSKIPKSINRQKIFTATRLSIKHNALTAINNKNPDIPRSVQTRIEDGIKNATNLFAGLESDLFEDSDIEEIIEEHKTTKYEYNN